ncbi:uncharacterized protein SCHCODRAFT_02021706 [Schizophyllum commune H4-8]|uniref:uncharacterized protein n=1 Tax=Schizophyllum commune (strain H4-8 / FGSC 9210) TaxID=578458 RepID=UPI002160F076|nr:uncharacterized protein SCHCODRAFT_02021706 [Schizophyllum commune H4-8]KAI5899844.1 hypothetical protein SCHCODRAFT_02021706 [Schizophyllum commune H4-8]
MRRRRRKLIEGADWAPVGVRDRGVIRLAVSAVLGFDGRGLGYTAGVDAKDTPAMPDTQTLKRKRPPTFVHLPAQKAQKLRRDWIETQKLKSKWRAQKRREGLVKPRTGEDDEGGAHADEDWDEEQGKEDADDAREERHGGETRDESSDEEQEDEDDEASPDEDKSEDAADSDEADASDEDATTSHPPARHGRGHHTQNSRSQGRGQQPSRGQRPSRGRGGHSDHSLRGHDSSCSQQRSRKRYTDDQGPPHEPTLRDRARAAYHPDSLHTVKAGQGRGGRGHGGSRGRGGRDSGRGGSGGNGGRGDSHDGGRGGRGGLGARGGHDNGRGGRDSRDVRGGSRNVQGGREGRGGRGRGQPNMALRMEVMLEKIKRDYA